ncbi:type II toxin-antitoxin system PemK/MazF family toxin [Methylobacterium sp. J-026]|uniref:type II toxin-antitoxin system PemK/MazF family toxin n=1 Tax=Methylobacterium sp. J-026 TaxID=2836624 RepID=UPI001FB990B2|nr:type II toxin-antitoxin system PemK/MazF family toxin [Methylobacterium sp. J-026]MCJ2138208.1 type II toxin-antitoxin system PemK/MazF family toxin [Methylobacterium sp. J-026]
MTAYERFDVLTALFPFIDVPVRKPRPVMVLSNGAFNDTNGHVVTAMITTGAGSHWPSDHAIVDLAAAGLRHPSVVRCKVFTLPNGQIGRRIGHLGLADRTRLAAHFAAILHA